MSVLAPGETGREPRNELAPYAPDQIAAIGFETFRLSQGLPRLQEYFIHYIAACEPSCFSVATVADAQDILWQRAERFVAGRGHSQPITERQKIKELRGIPMRWGRALEAAPDADREALSRTILLDAIARDYMYLVLGHGRPHSVQDGVDVHAFSKYNSHVVSHAILGRSTGVPACDDAFVRGMNACAPDAHGFVVKVSDEANGRIVRMTFAEALYGAGRIHFEHYPSDYERLSDDWKQFFTPSNWLSLRV